MANQEQLEILKQGVDVWNAWREDNWQTDIDLTRADLQEAELDRAMLREANLYQADLKHANLQNANLLGAELQKANLEDAFLENADLNQAQLSGANLNGAFLNNVDLSRSNLQGAELFRTSLNHANLRMANLKDAFLMNADLYFADLMGASLENAELYGTHLQRANLQEVKFQKANLENANFHQTIFGFTDFRQAINLDRIKHLGPSYLDTKTLAISMPLPIEFLLGCGLQDWEIEQTKLYQKDLTDFQISEIHQKVFDLRTNDAIQFNSCFISYSHKDEEFARKLYDTLQNKGIRCWYAPEDLKIGDRTRNVISNAINSRDKLLLILSEESVESAWVEHEVNLALDRELYEKRSVLFPIRLDDAVKDRAEESDPNYEWCRTIWRGRHTGDFTGWENKNGFQKGLDRLLRDLRKSS